MLEGVFTIRRPEIVSGADPQSPAAVLEIFIDDNFFRRVGRIGFADPFTDKAVQKSRIGAVRRATFTP